MAFKKLAMIALIAMSGTAHAQTQGMYEQSMAEARLAVKSASNSKALASLLFNYQLEATYECKVSFLVSQGVNSAYALPQFVGNLVWGVVVGKEIIRETTGEQGRYLNPQYKIAKGAVKARFSETNKTHIGEYGSCTLALAKVSLVKAEAKSRGERADVTVEVDGQDRPVVIIPDQNATFKK